MKKFVVETYYTCSFKTSTLDELNEGVLENLDTRSDDVEIEVKLNNRKKKN